MLNVIVTGGSRGLGLAIACRLKQAGYRVVAIARRPGERLSALLEEATPDDGGALHFRAFDLAELSAIPNLVKTLRREFGPIYGLVNNAALGSSGVLATMPDAEIEHLVRLNTLSPLMLTKQVVRSMMANGGGGRILNLASIVASTGYSGLSVYSATKAAMLGFTRSLARELGPLGITVNALAPGFVDTEMTEALGEADREKIVRRSALHRLAGPQDVAEAAEFLLGDRARNITGTVLTVDAGNTA
ncbi:MAG: SDR family oxidoreductase [Alphaproteobacteria bacterium]|nr:SDR family oxidoreductase [Alphaproteobacteria bacterium]